MSSLKFKELTEDRKWEIVEDYMGDYWWEPIIEEAVEELEEHGFDDADIQFTGFWSQGDGASFTCKHIDVTRFIKKHWSEMKFRSNQIESWEESAKLGLDGLLQLGFEGHQLGIIRPVLNIFLEDDSALMYGSVDRGNSRYFHENSTTLNLDFEDWEVVEDPEDRDLEHWSFTQDDERELIDFYKHLESWMEDWIRSWNSNLYKKLEKQYWEYRDELYKEFEEENETWKEFRE